MKPQLDLDDLKRRIRARADAHRKSDETASRAGHRESARIAPVPDVTVAPLALQPDLVPNETNTYHADDLLAYHDRDFIRAAYSAILKREPDEFGMEYHLKELRAGTFTKRDILRGLRGSDEGQVKNVALRGLDDGRLLDRLERLPVFGTLVRLARGLAMVPRLARKFEELETWTAGRDQATADHVNRLAEELAAYTGKLAKVQVRLNQIFFQQHRFNMAVLDRLDALESKTRTLDRAEEVQAEVRRLRADLTRLERRSETGAAPPMVASVPVGDASLLDALYRNFEDHFRGERAEIKKRLEAYLPFLDRTPGAGGVLDLGCGRGEWLELLAERGIPASGVDANTVLVEECRAAGFTATAGDAIAYLKGLPDNGVRAITSFHVVEHLPFETLVAMIDECLRVLTPGGCLILETPNPENILVGSRYFYLDPTHRNPLPPDLLEFLLKSRGLARLETVRLSPGNLPIPGEGPVAEFLGRYFNAPMDFGVVGWKV